MNNQINPKAPFEKELYKLLAASVVQMTEEHIVKVYNNLNDFSKRQPSDFVYGKSKLWLSDAILRSSDRFGVDFPAWFGDPSKTKIMVIGIDPLRNYQTFKQYAADPQEKVILGTPYALHDEYMREKKTKVYWDFVKTLSNNHCVYLTDVYKCYFHNNISNLRSYHYFEQNNLVYNHMQLLKSEIGLISPTHIITFGGIAWKMLQTIDSGVNIIDLIHPAARANHWLEKIDTFSDERVKGVSNENKVKYLLSKVNVLAG